MYHRAGAKRSGGFQGGRPPGQHGPVSGGVVGEHHRGGFRGVAPPGPAQRSRGVVPPGQHSTPGGSGGSSPRVVRPYGDTTGDGRVQVSFTLPVPFGSEIERARAEGAALQLAGKMGLDPAMVVHAKGIGPDFTFFIVYGRVSHLVD
ncbi:MAG: OAM dimerization domain-containing protein, partial [Streptosporangiaceae bacterium]